MQLHEIDFKKFILGLLFLITLLLIQNERRNNINRYQFIVQAPYEGDSKDYKPVRYVIDSKTGKVNFLMDVNGTDIQLTWSPKNKLLEIDTLKVKNRIGD